MLHHVNIRPRTPGLDPVSHRQDGDRVLRPPVDAQRRGKEMSERADPAVVELFALIQVEQDLIDNEIPVLRENLYIACRRGYSVSSRLITTSATKSGASMDGQCPTPSSL